MPRRRAFPFEMTLEGSVITYEITKSGEASAAVSDTVDVIADSNYSNVSEAYNHAFRAWRNKEDNPYAFRCKKQKKEAVYIEGKGFHEPDPAAEERRSLIQITMVIGMAIFAIC